MSEYSFISNYSEQIPTDGKAKVFQQAPILGRELYTSLYCIILIVRSFFKVVKLYIPGIKVVCIMQIKSFSVYSVLDSVSIFLPHLI